MKIAVLLGTSRYDGNTYQLVEVLNESLPVDILLLKDYQISEYDYDHKNIDDDFIPLIETLLNYDHIIFASPIYWYAMSAQMKIFFDRLSDLLTVRKDTGRALKGMECSILSTGSGFSAPNCFEEVFAMTFDYLQMSYKGMLYCQCDEDFVKETAAKSINSFIAASISA